ncbi:hypothetical protein IHE44_0010969 [Lamprotornis superbus]|uniref:Uncharacterized protein n=1 Tax=Lamprotornis superbus TaxID=245042 RepID=A0A835TPB8_9PASS|nr:hypothetical protein IHE44_0010969 [Lamprotornis superbus]
MGAAERGGAGGAVPRALLSPAGQAQPIAAPVQLEAGAHHPHQGGGAAARQWLHPEDQIRRGGF